jgi:hypothetical protein
VRPDLDVEPEDVQQADTWAVRGVVLAAVLAVTLVSLTVCTLWRVLRP